jgi:hypothetical protein
VTHLWSLFTGDYRKTIISGRIGAKQRSAGVRHFILIEVRKEPKRCPKNNSSGTGYMILLLDANKFLVDPLFFTPTCMNIAPTWRALNLKK